MSSKNKSYKRINFKPNSMIQNVKAGLSKSKTSMGPIDQFVQRTGKKTNRMAKLTPTRIITRKDKYVHN